MHRAVFVSALLILGCRQAAPRAVFLRCDVSRSETDTTCVMWSPSLIALIATPDRYHMKPVRVIGFANLEFEGNALYVDREAFNSGLLSSAVWIDLPDSLVPKDSSLRRGYYIVEGRFRADIRGHMGMNSGTIDSITRFEPWPSRGDIETRRKNWPTGKGAGSDGLHN
jgi:hypothetical protein